MEEAPKATGSRLAFSKREREHMEDKTIEDIVSILSSPDADIPKSILSRISKLLVRSGAGENIIRERLEDILGRDANRVDDILDIILDGKTDEAKFGGYLANRTISYKVFLGRPTSYYSVFKSTGISQQALGDLIEYKWSANPNLGIAEVALAILLKGGSRPTRKGDLAIDGMPFEVGGIGKRLKGQRGFGGANDIRKGFISEYNSLLENLDITEDIIKVPTEANRWGTKKGAGWLHTIQEIQSKIVDHMPDESKSRLRNMFANTLAESFTYLFQNASSNDIFKWIYPLLNDDGTLQTEKFKQEFMIQNILYYTNLEQGEDRSNYFVLSDYDNAVIFETTRKGIEKSLGYIDLYNWASFTPGAASGIATGIALKQ